MSKIELDLPEDIRIHFEQVAKQKHVTVEELLSVSIVNIFTTMSDAIINFQKFVVDQTETNAEVRHALKEYFRPSLKTSVKEHFNPRVSNALIQENIWTLRELMAYDLPVLWRVPGIGKTAYSAIETFLLTHDFISEPIKKR